MQKPKVAEDVMSLAKCIVSMCVGVLLVFYGASTGLTQQETSREFRTLALDPQSEIRFAAPWTPSEARYSNAQELVVLGSAGTPAKEQHLEQQVQFPIARALITIEPRTNYADAQARLEAIAASRGSSAEFMEIGGWPAVEVKFIERLPRRGAKEEEGEEPITDLTVQRSITAIASDDKVVRFDVIPTAGEDLHWKSFR
jgi:hypothetical protein